MSKKQQLAFVNGIWRAKERPLATASQPRNHLPRYTISGIFRRKRIKAAITKIIKCSFTFFLLHLLVEAELPVYPLVAVAWNWWDDEGLERCDMNNIRQNHSRK